MSNVVVFDIGGTKTTATVFSEAGEDLLGGVPVRSDTLVSAEPDEFVERLVSQIFDFDFRFGEVVGWGTAFPGPYRCSEAGELIVFPRNLPKMRGTNLEAAMRVKLPKMHGYVDNDLKLALWGEHIAGVARGRDNVVGFVHSTGVSSAVLIDGQIVRGRDNNAGEIGCLRVEYNSGPARPCDAQEGHAFGHLEAQIRGPVLAELFLGADRRNPLEVRAALESASNKDKVSMIEYCVPYVVSALAPICQLASASLLTLHGGIAAFLGDAYAHAIQSRLRDASEAFANDGKVRLASDQSRAPLIGAADLAFAEAGRSMARATL